MPDVTRYPRRRSSSRGFTLLEMLVAGMLGVIVLMFITDAWRWYGHSTHDTQISAQLTKELKLGADAIAQDFGPSVGVRTVDGTTLQIDQQAAGGSGIPAWTAPDTVIEYALQGSQLIRHDLTGGSSMTAANHIGALSAAIVDGKFHVHLTSQFASMSQDVTLELDQP